MSRDAVSGAEALSTLKKRTNEKGVAVALGDLKKIADSTPNKLQDPKLAAELVDALAKILLQGVGPQDKYEKLKTPANYALTLRVMKVIAQSFLKMLPKILGDNFFKVIAQSSTDSDVTLALLEFYIVVRSYARGDYEVFQWLKQSGVFDICLNLSKTYVTDGNKPDPSDTRALGAYTCMQALEYLAGDLTYQSVSQISSFNFNAIEFAKAFLQIKQNSNTWRMVKQKMCGALANLIVPWRKFSEVNDPTMADKEKELAIVVIIRIKEDVSKMKAAKANVNKSDAPNSELRFLRNWCYNSRRIARLLVELNVHEMAISLLQMAEFLKGSETLHAAAGLLRNLARKQVKTHQALLSKGLDKVIKQLVQTHNADLALLNAMLGCMLNLTSSNVGRASLFDISEFIAAEIIPRNIDSPDICELAVGILWGITSRSNPKGEEHAQKFYDAYKLVLQRHGTDFPGCTRRTLGAVIAMLSAYPGTSAIYINVLSPVIPDIKAKFSNDSKVVTSDLVIIEQLANRTLFL